MGSNPAPAGLGIGGVTGNHSPCACDCWTAEPSGELGFVAHLACDQSSQFEFFSLPWVS